MVLEQLRFNVSYVDLALLVLIIAAWVLLFRLLKERGKTARLTREIAALQQQQKELQEQFKHGSESLKEALKQVLFDKTRALAQRVTELARGVTRLHQRNEALIAEVEGKVEPVKEALSDSVAKFDASHETLRKMIWGTGEEVKKITSTLHAFSQELKQMKEFLRERSIDLEL
jgi:DNA repair exonuclease SbcCD ATPase subunit